MLLRRPHDLGPLLRDGRVRAGWSQTQLAERVGVSRQWISQVETGKTSVEFDLVVAALQALGYQLYAESSGPPTLAVGRPNGPPEPLVHTPARRTLLTRGGKTLGKQRIRRRPRLDRDA